MSRVRINERRECWITRWIATAELIEQQSSLLR